jgi:hypothetical protein
MRMVRTARLGVVVALLGIVAAGAAPAARQALTIGAVSVSPRALSAEVSWRASQPARAVVEVGLGPEYGIWSKTVKGESGRIYLGGLEPSTSYSYRIVADAGSGRRSSWQGSFRTAPISSWTGATATRYGLFLDGQPLFPRMVAEACGWQMNGALAAGINLFLGGCTDARTLIADAAGRAYLATSVAERGIEGKGLIGWHQLDEADEHLGPESLPKLPPSKQTKRVTFLTLTSHFYSGAAPLPQGRPDYEGFIARADMVGFDLYPLTIWCQSKFAAVYAAQRELIALAGAKPTYQWIEAAPMTGCNRFVPTPESVRVETWLAIAAGARGIGYFPTDWSPDIAKEIGALGSTIRALSPALLSSEIPVSSKAGALKVGARSYHGATYVIAVNSSSRLRMRAAITVPGLKASSVRVFGEGKTLLVRGGVIRDVLAPLQARVYIAPPPRAPTAP